MIEPSHPAPSHQPSTSDSSMAGIIFVTGAFFGMGLMVFIMQIWGWTEDDDLEHYRSVRNLVLETYVGETTEQELLESALQGMLGSLDDYSRYYVEEEVDVVTQDTTGQTIGIGIIMRNANDPTILFPVAGSPAEKAGLRVGDKIVSLDGTPVENLDSDQVTKRIRGEEGSELVLTVIGRDGKERKQVVQRQQLLVPSVRRVRMIDEERQIGYMAIVSFSNESLAEFDAAIEELNAQGLQGLVIDLRSNPGGVLSAAVGIAERFIPSGALTSTEGRGAPQIENVRPDQTRQVGLPLVVLIDQNSASASEVLAGALQDHRAALLVGSPSYGKGVVQTISHYKKRRAIAKLTTSYYYTPAHRNVQRSRDDSHAFGLLPDIDITISQDEAQEVRRYLMAFEPSPESLPELRAWLLEDPSLGIPIDPPKDSQLEAALALFAGHLPTFSSDG